MGVHKIKKGLDLPIEGEPVQEIELAPTPNRIALLADDYPGMRPTTHVAVGDSVRRGQVLFEDKKTVGVLYTAPASGEIVSINRGERRALQSVVLKLDTEELSGGEDCKSFESYSGRHPSELNAQQIRDLLVESGLWTALRMRPYGKVPAIDSVPHSVFITAIDSQPLAPSVEVVIEGRENDFLRGVTALSKIAAPAKTYICKAIKSNIAIPESSNIRVEEFGGPHPSGTAGLHIHVLDPVDRNKIVWHVDYQDTMAIGKLFATGKLPVNRVISLAGPAVLRPRLLHTRIGASTQSLTNRELDDGEVRVLSGSVIAGRQASGEIFGYLGRYHSQVSVLREDSERRFLAWMSPGFNIYSVLNLFFSKLLPGKKFAFTTSANGSCRAMVPVGIYERILPMSILPAPLLRALLQSNVERAEQLGALELIEEDLALCSFVSPEKASFGLLLRDVLIVLEKEG